MRLAPLMLSEGAGEVPSMQEPSGQQRRRLPAVLSSWGVRNAVGIIAAISLPVQKALERECVVLAQELQLSVQPPTGGNCRLFSHSFLYELLQIGPDLGISCLSCVDPSVEWLFCTGSLRILTLVHSMLTGC